MPEPTVRKRNRKGFSNNQYRTWTEYQVAAGRNVISRHPTREAAEQAWKQLTRKKDDAPAQ